MRHYETLHYIYNTPFIKHHTIRLWIGMKISCIFQFLFLVKPENYNLPTV